MKCRQLKTFSKLNCIISEVLFKKVPRYMGAHLAATEDGHKKLRLIALPVDGLVGSGIQMEAMKVKIV